MLTYSPNATTFIIGTTLLAFVSFPQYAAVYATLNESVPAANRARFFALIYSIPVAIFGSTTHPFMTWLLHVTNNPIALAGYFTGVSMIGLLAMVFMEESSPKHIKLRISPVV